jgi:hypothetical protein
MVPFSTIVHITTIRVLLANRRRDRRLKCCGVGAAKLLSPKGFDV